MGLKNLVKARADFKVEAFATLKGQLQEEFPEVTEQRGFHATGQIGQDKLPASSTKDLGLRGFFFKSKDGLNIAQFRIDGFTYNRLKPYTSWDEVFPAALKLWKLYAQTAFPTDITRLALRYINHIEWPSGVERFEEVMIAPPPIPKDLPEYVSNFLTRVTVQDPHRRVAAHITQALESRPSPDKPKATLILDIDAFHQGDLQVGDEKAEASVRDIFEKLRSFKNEIFLRASPSG